MTKLRTAQELEVGRNIGRIFEACSDSTEVKLENFTKYVRRQHLKRFLALYEIFKLVLPVKGSVVECGVFRGFSLMAWAKLSAILEPENLTRRIYGMDSFSGFPAIGVRDQNLTTDNRSGDLLADSHDELTRLIQEYDADRFLGHLRKVELIRGDMVDTIPKFIRDHPHVLVSLLFIDCDLYEPTRVALETFLPRMPKGAVLAFDDLDNPAWPGETLALLESHGVRSLELRRLAWDPYIAYVVID